MLKILRYKSLEYDKMSKKALMDYLFGSNNNSLNVSIFNNIEKISKIFRKLPLCKLRISCMEKKQETRHVILTGEKLIHAVSD